MQKPLFTLVLTLISVLSVAQEYTFSGTVKNEKGESIHGASVRVLEHRRGARTNPDGEFSIQLPQSSYSIRVSHMGSETQTFDLNLNEDISRDIVLRNSGDESIDEVTVVGKVGVKKVKESAYNVTVLDAKPTYNSSMEVTSLLNRAAGVKIRQEAGLGSDYNISLNGFTGRAVKIFMDGVPMEGFGTAYNLNNIPTTMIERVDIYKGVVPIEFGGDAMGGVINIITRPLNRTYVDASYSYGSFNTHKSNVNFGYVGKSGFSVDIRALQNYSDNSYRTYTKSLNLENETFSPDKAWYNRFNDTYHNESLVAKVGWVHTSWADQFFIGATIGQEYKEIQNAYVQQLVYGMRHRKGNTIMPSLTYQKRNFLVDNLDLSVNANYNQNRNENIDTAARTYNWAGDFKRKRSVGEGASILSKFENRNGSVTANAKYALGQQH
ncbi:MAG: TonB-dependent receptor plug domain-containing protein, partial [Sphingobacterium sp.]